MKSQPVFLSLQFTILLMLLTAVSTFSQQSIKFEHLSMEQGLSNIHVQCLFQDSKGFIWVGTKEGLNQYDGYSFNTYTNDPKDSTTISSSDIRGIAEDTSGHLWIATSGGGLSVFD